MVLKNGARGLLVYVPAAEVMTFEFNFRAGEYLVDPQKWEVPHLMEHVLLGANERFLRARDFSAELEKNGAYSNASTGVYDITYEAECADFEWDRILDLLLVAIAKPLFKRDEFTAEYGNVEEELTARANNHFRELSLSLRQAYGFLAKTDAERLQLMKNVKLKDIREHYEATHRTGNMRFVIAGNLTPKRAEQIEETLEQVALPKGRRIALPDERPHALQKPLYIDNPTVKNVYFYVDTFLKHRLSEPESDALNLTNTLLTETLHSKILGKARESGLIYGMSSGINESKLCSGWWFGAQVSRKNAGELCNIIVEEMNKLFTGDLPTKDIEAAQAYALGRYQRSAQTVGGTANGYSERYFFDDVIEDYYQIPKRIRDITRDSIIAVAREMFAGSTWGVGALGNCGEDFALELQDKLAPLWQNEPAKSAKV
ncbi:MAG TPA: pitrilysin family protein [Candidatus Saccharimonadales bacterium]